MGMTPLLQLIEDKKASSDRSLNVSESSTGSQKKKKKRLSLSSSLSKVFSRGKARRSIALSQADSEGGYQDNFKEPHSEKGSHACVVDPRKNCNNV